MAKKPDKKLIDLHTQAIAQATSDRELLEALLDYLELLQGSLDLVLEHIKPSLITIPEIGVTPEAALDSALDNLNSKLIQARAKRLLFVGLDLPDDEVFH